MTKIQAETTAEVRLFESERKTAFALYFLWNQVNNYRPRLSVTNII